METKSNWIESTNHGSDTRLLLCLFAGRNMAVLLSKVICDRNRFAKHILLPHECKHTCVSSRLDAFIK